MDVGSLRGSWSIAVIVRMGLRRCTRTQSNRQNISINAPERLIHRATDRDPKPSIKKPRNGHDETKPLWIHNPTLPAPNKYPILSSTLAHQNP
ncbi:hypothetical protein VNO78_31219 [Psophocarpus tetragonolobus]|uniref:Uncharacterized protein n=1 Tax=Psophocarpus tetragonolobus TaxID=3891 RepID=A0AAN9X7B2_PSOTE